MAESANVRSIDAVKNFHAAVVRFQEEARLAISSLEMQLLRFIGWLERDRPTFWKREIETCYREMSEWRVRLHQCKMRKMGDFKPTCFEEKKALEKAKKDLEHAQKQVPIVKHWTNSAHHEANEYHGRASQMTQLIERDIPMLLAMLHQVVDRLEAYGNVQTPGQLTNASQEGRVDAENVQSVETSSVENKPSETEVEQ
jgi:hypothetical protein